MNINRNNFSPHSVMRDMKKNGLYSKGQANTLLEESCYRIIMLEEKLAEIRECGMRLTRLLEEANK